MLNGVPVIYGIKPLKSGSTAQHEVGALGVGSDGRLFRYVKAGGSDISVGKLQLAPAPITDHHDLAVNTASSGDKTLDITPGNTAGSANIYAGGLVVVNDDTGEGFNYRIKAHPAITASTEFTANLVDPIETAFGAATTVTLRHNPYNGIVEGTTQTQQPVGVAQASITSGEFGWVCSRGETAVLRDEDGAVGQLLTIGSSVAGAVEDMDDQSGAQAEWNIGFETVAGVAEEYNPAFITLD